MRWYQVIRWLWVNEDDDDAEPDHEVLLTTSHASEVRALLKEYKGDRGMLEVTSYAVDPRDPVAMVNYAGEPELDSVPADDWLDRDRQ